MNVGDLKKALENIDDETIVLVEDDDLKVHYTYYAELDEYKNDHIDNGLTPLIIRC
jgi:hypothetical protein